jgi:hypothetical protein
MIIGNRTRAAFGAGRLLITPMQDENKSRKKAGGGGGSQERRAIGAPSSQMFL